MRLLCTLLTVTLPVVDPVLEAALNSSYAISQGQSNRWTCAVKAASYADVVWKFNDVPIPLVEGSHILNCSDPNSTVSKNVFVTYTESYVSSYISRHQSVMHICNASINNTGEYHCVVEYLHGGVFPVGSFHLDITLDVGKRIMDLT